MKKIFFAILPVFILGACKKSKDQSDPYTGTSYIKFHVASNTWFIKNSGSGYPYLSSTEEGWKIVKVSNGQYTLSPATDMSRVLSNTGVIGPALIIRPSPLTNKELFSFETNTSGLLNIKSVSDNKYLVFQYGMSAPGSIIFWAFWIDDKTLCHASFSGNGASSNGCQYDFELVRQ